MSVDRTVPKSCAKSLERLLTISLWSDRLLNFPSWLIGAVFVMPGNVRNPVAYLTKVVAEFANECDATWESRNILWRSVVLAYELSDDPEPWVDKLVDIAEQAGMKQRDVQTTLVSALRRARSTGAVA
jgi:hypothetical protein